MYIIYEYTYNVLISYNYIASSRLLLSHLGKTLNDILDICIDIWIQLTIVLFVVGLIHV